MLMRKSTVVPAILMVLAGCMAPSAAAASSQPPYFDYEVIEAPPQTDAVALPTASPAEPDHEQWMLQNGNIGVRNVTRPTLTPILPAGPSTGAAVIVAPGGGFLGLSIDTEGWQIARWLANHGIAAFVLKYRVLPTPVSNPVWEDEFNRMIRGEKVSFANPADTPPEALADGLAALRHVRENANSYGIDPKRVGFMGFSAGGFLARSLIERGGNDMPAFIAPIYPNMAAVKAPENSPPIFVAIAQDDFLLLRERGFPLVESYRAARKPVEFHLFSSGGHGFGIGVQDTATDGWMDLFYRWLASNGLLKGKRR